MFFNKFCALAFKKLYNTYFKELGEKGIALLPGKK